MARYTSDLTAVQIKGGIQGQGRLEFGRRAGMRARVIRPYRMPAMNLFREYAVMTVEAIDRGLA
jgi:hypothetical protein